MNDITTTSGTNTVAGLPIPPKEKVARWFAHGGVIALGVTGIITFMPFINKALELLLNGVWTFAQLGFAAAVTFFGAFAIMTLWPLYKRFIESLANKATWALFEYDPITPLVEWLKEVIRDLNILKKEYLNVNGVISQNEKTIADSLGAAEKADRQFATAVQKYGRDSSEAQLMSLEPGSLRETAERVQVMTEPLYVMRETLKEIVDATAFMARKAELDVDNLRMQFSVAQNVENATASAERALQTRSQRKQNAMTAMRIIHDKYAGSFGRLQGLRDLSREIITSVDMQKGTYHQEALERLKAESRFITGAKKPELLEAKQVAQVGGVSFYKVPEPVRASRK